MIDILTIITVGMCAFGLILCIYILVHKEIDTKLPLNNTIICSYGMGWMVFLMQALSGTTISMFGGVSLFFIAYCLWAYKHLSIFTKLQRK